jgi:hypothetical protein
MYSSELYFISVNSIYLFNQKSGHKSLSVLAIMTELPLLKMHGRWVTDRSKDGYIKDDLESQMAVSLNLGI